MQIQEKIKYTLALEKRMIYYGILMDNYIMEKLLETLKERQLNKAKGLCSIL